MLKFIFCFLINIKTNIFFQRNSIELLIRLDNINKSYLLSLIFFNSRHLKFKFIELLKKSNIDKALSPSYSDKENFYYKSPSLNALMAYNCIIPCIHFYEKFDIQQIK